MRHDKQSSHDINRTQLLSSQDQLLIDLQQIELKVNVQVENATTTDEVKINQLHKPADMITLHPLILYLSISNIYATQKAI